MPSRLKILKFQTRTLLNRLGLWDRIERWRLKWRFARRQPHEPEFAFYQHFDGSTGLFVDIGANLGQSALSLACAQHTCNIISFEPNIRLEPALRTVADILGPRFTYRMHGLGAENATRTFFIPSVAGVPFFQCGTLRREVLVDNPGMRELLYEVTGSRTFDIQEQPISIRRFDDLGLKPEFVKMDVEGAELDVLEGMPRTLSEHRPLVTTEGCGAVEWLAKRGYRAMFHDAAANALESYSGGYHQTVFHVPEEKLSAISRLGRKSHAA